MGSFTLSEEWIGGGMEVKWGKAEGGGGGKGLPLQVQSLGLRYESGVSPLYKELCLPCSFLTVPPAYRLHWSLVSGEFSHVDR